MKNVWSGLIAFCIVLTVGFPAQSQGQVNVLFLTKSAGYEHGVIKRDGGKPGHAQKIMYKLARKHGFRLIATKDAGMINKHTLRQFDVVMFYTTGDLTKRGDDGNPPMSESGRKALISWVKEGGAFVGTHSSTDTFKNWEENGMKPYVNMVGGRFDGHGSQQNGKMNVGNHPSVAHLGSEWELKDEYYMFDNLSSDLQPLLMLQANSMKEQKYKKRGNYPIAWYKTFGKGRVWHSALGHRKDVWTNEKFQKHLIRGIRWALQGN